jgi:hypothetical protein
MSSNSSKLGLGIDSSKTHFAGKSIVVSGNITGKQLSLSGNAFVKGNLKLNGSIDEDLDILGDVSIGGGLAVVGDVVAANITTGDITASGALSAVGNDVESSISNLGITQNFILSDFTIDHSGIAGAATVTGKVSRNLGSLVEIEFQYEVGAVAAVGDILLLGVLDADDRPSYDVTGFYVQDNFDPSAGAGNISIDSSNGEINLLVTEETTNDTVLNIRLMYFNNEA